MEERPQFNEIKSFEEFSKYYWYRNELKQICKNLGITYSGIKADLYYNIEEYFKGNLIQKKIVRKNPNMKPAIKNKQLSLKTSLLECNFCFSQKFRDFFSAQTGIKKFKFNANMVASAKKVKEENDNSFTLGDMLEIYYGRKEYAKYDTSFCQWNKFLKDFCSDDASADFSNKLKTASILWNEVRNSTKEKVYTKELLVEFADKIENYRK